VYSSPPPQREGLPVAHPRSAGQPSGDRAPLQPGHPVNDPPSDVGDVRGEVSIKPVAAHWLAEAEAELFGSSDGELSAQDRDRMRRAAESLARRDSDREKLNNLALQGFAGPDYEIFAGELAAYSYPVIVSWLRRGVIFKYCADKGRPVRVTDADRELLADSFDDRLGIAMETVAAALKFFRNRVLLEHRWSYYGGASLTTFFTGACLFAFPNVFRRWQGEQRRHREAHYVELLNCQEGGTRTDGPGTDPADLITRRATIIDALNNMPPGTRAAAALVLDGLSFADAGACLGTTDRGVEGRLYRYRDARDKERESQRQA
jgi:DNA-directed RNA polymerase specialized sigma24 family protein